MNSSRYYKSSNIETERRYNSFWKKKDNNNTHFSRPNIPLSQFLEENDKKSNYIEFANVNLKKLSAENFNDFIENIISSLCKKEPGETEEEKKTITREALFNLMKHGLIYHKSAPIMNLLISLNSSAENQNQRKYKEFDYDDYIIFYLKQICKNFTKFDDFLDSMVLLSEYLAKNFLKSNSIESDPNKKAEKQKIEKIESEKEKEKENEKEKEKDNEKKNIADTTNTEKDSNSNSGGIPNSNTNSNQGLFDTLIKYIYCSNRYEIFTLYPVFSTILSILCKTNTYPACEILLNLLLIYKIDISTSAINSYIDYLCRNNYLEQCHDILSILVKYFPEYSIPAKMATYLKENYGEAHNEETNQIIKKEKNGEKDKDKDKVENPLNNYNFKFNCEKNLISYGINIVSFGIYLKYLCKNDFLDLALLVYDELNKNNILQDEVIYNLLLNGCSKKLDIKNLHRVYMDMINKNIKPNLITYNTIIDAFIRNKNTEKAFKIFDEMINKNISPDNFTLSTLFKGIYKPEHNKYLIQGVNIISNNTYPIDIILINVLLDACIKLKDEKNFNQIFENIINKKYRNIKPDLITYNTYIKGCSKFKLYENIEKAFTHLINNYSQNNIIPNDVTFNSLIDSYVSQKNMEKVIQTVNLMQKYKILPDNYTFTTIIKGLNKNSLLKNNNNNSENKNANLLQNYDFYSNIELDLAFQLFNHVRQNSKPDEILYNCIMDACLRFNRIDIMLDMYKDMIKNNIKPSSITCGIIIKAYGMKGDIKSAMDIYYKMKNEKIEISNITYGCLINACIRNNDLTKAFELYEALKKESYEMNTILYTTLIKAYTKQKDLDKVVEIFDTMKKSTNSKPNIITYNSIIDCCIKCNNFTLAYEYFKEMLFDINNTSENSIRPDIVTFSTLIKGEINNKCFGNARKLMQKLLEYNYIKLDCVLLNTLLDGCDKCECYEEAMDIFSIFKSKKVICNMMTYSILMKICGKLNDFENSYKLLNELKENNISFNLIIITCFIKTCCNTNHLVEGLNTFKDLPKYNIYPDNIAYSTIILGIISNIQYCDYSDELINLVKKSIEDRAHLNKKIYLKCLFYLNLLNHKDKADSLSEYLKEKKILSIYQTNSPNNNTNEENSEKKDSKSSNSNSNDTNSNESTNNKTLNSTVTNFNLQKYGYGFFNTINALNMIYFQKCYMENKGLLANKTNISSTKAESCNTFKKGTSLKEIYENNMSYPFVYKKKEEKNISNFDYSKNENKDNPKMENNEGTPFEEKVGSS
jgi:pentatricopeptide repeat protein